MENKEEILRELEESRKRMHDTIDERYDEMINAVQTGNHINSEPSTYSLSYPPALFKGKRPQAIIYPDGARVKLTTWQNFALELLTACNSENKCHEKLMELRNKISGRSRYILSDKPDGMDRPIRIDEGLYFEGKFDTEYLIKMMTENIFKRVGFQYEGIEVELKPMYQENEINTSEQPLKRIGPNEGKFGDEWVTYCLDKGIERENPQTGEKEICEGYFCQVYSDENLEIETDYFCLAVGYEIKNLSDDELNRGIIEYLGLTENMEIKM